MSDQSIISIFPKLQIATRGKNTFRFPPEQTLGKARENMLISLLALHSKLQSQLHYAGIVCHVYIPVLCSEDGL